MGVRTELKAPGQPSVVMDGEQRIIGPVVTIIRGPLTLVIVPKGSELYVLDWDGDEDLSPQMQARIKELAGGKP